MCYYLTHSLWCWRELFKVFFAGHALWLVWEIVNDLTLTYIKFDHFLKIYFDFLIQMHFIFQNTPFWLSWPYGKINRCIWIEYESMYIYLYVLFERERDMGLFRHSNPRSSYWVQTVRLLHRLGLRPPGSQRKVPFLAPFKLNCGHRPCNLETQLLIYQQRNYIRYSLSHCRPFERLHCEAGKPLAC